MISIVVNFFNNRREARNTLYSLSRAYQRGAGDLDYEVIVLDNGSSAPLAADEVRAYGPEFRHRFVETRSKSPAAAINAAAREARGEHLLVMIDGAHILSPGVLANAERAFRLFASPFVATCAFHLGPKRQNAAVMEGYDQAAEDGLLARSGWREDGYRLFLATRAFADLGNGWFGAMYESGCFGLRREDYLALGGLDERFQEPGGGLVNLEMYERALAQPRLEYVMLLGEGTFHQVHGGVATNAPLTDHPFLRFQEEYARLKGRPYERPLRRPFFMGAIPAQALAASAASASSGLAFWEKREPPDVDLFAAAK